MRHSELRADKRSAAPWGSRLLGSEEESSGLRRLRIQLLLTVSLVVSNFIGIVLSIVLIGFVLPGPTIYSRELVVLDAVVAPVYGTLAFLVGIAWGTARSLRTLRWATDPDQLPTAAEQAAAAAVPRQLVSSQALLWLGGLVVITTAYGLVDPALIPKFVFGIAFSAIVVCANSYLLIEFALRPITARVLDVAESRRRSGMGVFGRSLVVWVLGSGMPVAGLMVIAVLALTMSDVSTARLAVCVLSLGGAALVFGLLLMTQTMSAIVAPIRGVRRALRQVEDGDLGVAITVYDGTELGELQSGFNHMVDGLREREQIRDLFGKHVGREVADAALAGDPTLGGVECEAAALFIDIVGSTTMAATLPAPEIVAILNRFFAIVVDEVERHGGLLNKFEGDAALAVFGTPATLPDAPGAALACARAMRRRLDGTAANSTSSKSTAADNISFASTASAGETADSTTPDGSTAEIIAAIGVAAGKVVAGNVGAHQRYEFTVIGDAVNEAARLCELAKQDNLLLASAHTITSAAPAEATHWHLGESVTLRGRLTPTQLARPTP
ncbi:adenylate/guanylate cyclase domain-containing protein [Nocardia sp. NPDC052566]|uniref:adenylate/guanylate cyclase domain-containing protein n=1 Tax=Nocardia sp. NPDC052566 TaxID=3364330 RepID=UPI0037C6B9EE